MKKIILTISFAFVFLGFMNAQTVFTLASDTLQGDETVNFSNLRSSTSSGVIGLQAKCTQLGSTSGGTLTLKGSTDGLGFAGITETEDMFNFYPSDTLTITDGATLMVSIKDSPFKYYRIQGDGEVNDTALVVIKYTVK